MSGHSRWAQIKHKKAAIDAKKGQVFSKISRLIRVAVKEGGENPEKNLKLRSALAKAREVNMSLDNVERALRKSSEDKLEEVLYEAYGPGGSAFLIEGITDSKNRTSSEIKHILSEHGGKLAEPGSVLWMFEKKEAAYSPKFTLSLLGEDERKYESLLEVLSENDDVQEVYTNTD